MFFNNSNLTTQTKMFPTAGRSKNIQTHWIEDNENTRNNNELISSFSIIKNLYLNRQSVRKNTKNKNTHQYIIYSNDKH